MVAASGRLAGGSGRRTGGIAWAKVITDRGGNRNQFQHVIDVVPTILEATGIKTPATVGGIAQKPIEGVQRRFSRLMEGLPDRALNFSADDFLPFGVDWNAPANESVGKGFSRWAGELPGMRLDMSIEIPYANAGGSEVNQASACAFGRDIARALCAYLRSCG